MSACARCYKGWAVYKATLAEPRFSERSFAPSLLSESELEGFKKALQSINQATFVVVVAVVIVIVIIIISIIIVRSHLGSSVRVACEGRLLTNDVRGYTNRNVD